ncbi:rap guanine nucleotide exchange factor 6-like isoform X7 [Mercenaria mercenaria]|uniref:rap guanine nucleotide exchange factor 6-like isoform X7 n=1 Tax=Mercenaria mercenaria TaxID=6596 RepID=UPI00234E4B7E|nr:rap guanine nucleotide exchange factor 6-like isoform X7 [Mercenaria mercenaria]
MFPTSLERYSYNIHHDSFAKMASYTDRHFIACLQKPPHSRTDVDLDVIYSYLHGMEALSSLREPALRALCRTVRYEYHDANDILYCQRELSTCWYILLSGSVFIEGSMFLPRSSFGKRTPGCARRASECLILEPSEMIVIDYPDVQVMKPGTRMGPCNTMNLDRLPQYDPQDDIRMRRMNSDTSGFSEQTIPDIQIGYNGRDTSYGYKRCSRASDTSSAYSGSDMMQSSIDDTENVDCDLPSNLIESTVDNDSEDEEGFGESTESLPVRDAVRECLEKDPADRKDDDIEILLDFMQHFRAFANMTLATRRALCAVMVFAVVEKAGTIVMKDGEELDSWSVILNGTVAVETVESEVKYLQLGDSFGITPTMEKLYHQGQMHTITDDCQFVCIAQSDYYRILHQGEENTRRHEEDGKVVMVTEHRVFDGGNRKGHIVIRGTPERLMLHLVEDHSVVDPTYVEDFLLTYRTFLPSPTELTNKLLQWFEDPTLRAKVTRVVLLWVNNHFNDFEMNADMCEFLEHFEDLLEREKNMDKYTKARMTGQLRLLNLACASKARPRTVTLTRATRDEILYFQILGGLERGCGIFIKKVEKDSKAYEAGLKRGDQILEVNGQSMMNISHSKALELLRKTTHLSITVKSNLLEFKEMLDNTEKNATLKRMDFQQTNYKQRLSAPDLENSFPPASGNLSLENSLLPSPQDFNKKNNSHKKDRSFMMTIASSKPKLRKALRNLIPRNMSASSMNSDISLNHSDENLSSHGLSRKSSTSSGSSTNTGMSNHLSASNPDLSSANLGADEKPVEYPDHVVKVYRSDQSFKYLLIHKETTAKEVVMLSLREFGITDPSSNFSLCEVTVESEGFIKQKRLPDTLQNLPERLTLNGRDACSSVSARRALPCVLRYYLKNNMSTEPLVPDELMGDLIKEAQISLTQLNTLEVASQLTLEDFSFFKQVQDTEYVDRIFGLNSKCGCPNLLKFEELVNKEMFWVVTEICSENNLVKRMKIMKHFIKIARHCKDCKNFNSMFAIVSGLHYTSVSRLHSTWEKLPSKYKKMYESMLDLMDPSRNMSKYRNLMSSQFVQPPMIPFFPVVNKDLTFIHLGNDSKVDGLVNFEKLRMVAKEIRHICNMCSPKYDVNTMYLNTPSMYDSSLIFGVATIKRTKNRRASAVPNARKMYDEAQMTRRVKSYLSNLPCIRDEVKLAELSNQCEPQAKKPDSSPNLSASSSSVSSEEKKPIYTGPKFGAETVENTRKLMALSGKVKPHDSKNPLPPLITSPNLSSGGRRQPISPRHVRPTVHLSAESSSVISLSNIANRKPSRTGSVGSTESQSPTASIKSTHSNNSAHSLPSHYESDSSSLASTSTYDNHSSCSAPVSNSPGPPRKLSSSVASHHQSSSHPLHHPHVQHPHPHHPPQSVGNPQSIPAMPQPAVRPPLPPYHVVMQNAQGTSANSQYIHTTYTNVRRPPLPDYQSATHMAQVARQRHKQWAGSSKYYREEDFDHSQGVHDDEEEIVSAV